MDFTFAPPGWNSLVETLIGLGIVAAIALVATLLVKQVLLRIVWRLLARMEWDDDLPHLPVMVRRLANIVPATVVSRGVLLVPHLPSALTTVIGNVCSAFVILSLALALGAALSVGNEFYQRRPDAGSRPIKGYIQVLKIIIYGGAVILMAAALMERSPFLFLSGLGAMAAVLMLVFKDTILSLVASVQLTSNDMIRVGDWISMPQLNADGTVIDVALHTVKVQNFDHTIVTIPTYKLISDSFQNWRGMEDSGGRRIRRALHLDQNSVRYLTDEEIAHLEQYSLLRPYLAAKRQDLAKWNDGRATNEQRRLTNIGTLRAYIVAYLREHPDVRQHMPLLVRHLQPTAEGIPLEVYCFIQQTSFVDFEPVQADIFDHLIAMIPEFELRLFQHPTGADFSWAALATRTDDLPLPVGLRRAGGRG
ncbi:mechanosensitive ion channel family protein [Stakelama saccharophila]|uniref:Mechanosensitive ion channel family protein n=1 Tax=Stakelama saccharophila TaxID=3075605 RepID=A0ABZ0B7E3_9SPHN|nr:mechanosensitive ion channel family protein [Stakelama sp. W311]WNO53142.1 mechanosensitive ion channel family protein [Stakelama sp. W311]